MISKLNDLYSHVKLFSYNVIAQMEATDNSGVDGSSSRGTDKYPMVKETDMTEGMKADVSL